jgi:5'-nucleotidase (lipoprotein e(P4) family)
MLLRKPTTIGMFAVSIVVLALTGCAGRQAVSNHQEIPERTHELLNAVLWVRTSAEYEVGCREIYRLAERGLDQALSDPAWTAALEQTGDYSDLPAAVILDADETALDNSAFEAMLIEETEEYNKPLWYAWAEEERAGAVPGTREFLEHAFERGVQVFFVTNRDYAIEQPTVRNLQALFGPQVTAESVLSRGEMEDWTSDKSSRRAYVAAGHRILLLIGDDFNDFVYIGEVPPERRNEAARRYSAYWGTKWIMLPNPMYGGWEDALYGYDRTLPRGGKLKAKSEQLKAAP